MRYDLGILGAGVMGTAILGNLDLKNAAVYDIQPDKTACLQKKGATFVSSPQELVSSSDTIFFSVKPQNAAEIFENCDFSDVKYIVSIMAGTKIDSILSKINNPNVGIVRVMPNIPAKVKQGVSALCFRSVPEDKRKEIENVFRLCGSVLVIEEEMFDAVTSISGSGPAYVYLFLDALVKSAIEGGFDDLTAKKLAIDTVIGAARYAESEDVPLGEMVDRVCSKGGTTIEAIDYYREKDFVGIVGEGVRRCREKSKKLSEQTK